MNFYVTLDVLKTQAAAGKRPFDEVAARRLVHLEQGLWRKKLRPDGPVPLDLVMELAGIEFALWALPVATPTPGTTWTVDVVGRVVAAALGMEVFGKWLPEAEMLTGGHVSPAVAGTLAMDMALARKPIADWRAWMYGTKALLDTLEGQGYRASATAAVLFCAKSMVVPAGNKRLPSQQRLEAWGRHCAHEAYFDACYAWATGHERYREACRMAELAKPQMLDPAPLERAQATLFDALLADSDAAVAPIAEKALLRCLRGQR